jgi:BASS family bile acid:Na+ symporter
MNADQLINVLVTVTLVELMLAIGLGASFREVLSVATSPRAMLQAAVANYVCVPAAAVGLLWLIRAQPLVAAGILCAAVCPGAPYGPPLTAVAKGNTTAAVGLMVMLAASSAVVAPLLLRGLLPIVTDSNSITVDAGRMVGTLLATQLLPLFAGLALRQWRPVLAARLLTPANRLSAVLNLAVIVLILAAHFRALAEIRPVGFAAMLALVLSALAAGWLLGLPGSENRKAMAITTSVRNVGVSLVIATSSFPGTPAVTAALAFALFQTLVLALLAFGWGRTGRPIAAPGGERCLV